MKVAPTFLLLILLLTPPNWTSAQVPNLINYQGRLVDGGGLVNGNREVVLRLYNADPGGTLLYEDSNTVTVVDGLYSTFIGDDTLSGTLTDALTNAEVYVEVEVDGTVCAREQIASVSFALKAAGVSDGAISETMLADDAVTSSKIADGAVSNADLTADAVTGSTVLDGSLTGADVANGSISNTDVAANTFWETGGNAGTTVGGHFLGTTDNQPLELQVNGTRALWIEPGVTAPNLVGGDANNSVNPGVSGSTIAGGIGHSLEANFAVIGGGSTNLSTGDTSFIGGGKNNTVESTNSVIAGGWANHILGPQSGDSFIGGGRENEILYQDPAGVLYALTAVIGGGLRNQIFSNNTSVIAGGCANVLYDGTSSTIAGGWENIISNSCSWAFIGGGSQNTIGTNSDWALVTGGRRNLVHDESQYAVIGGGFSNSVKSTFSVIAGGHGNRIEGTNAVESFIGGGRENVILISTSSPVHAMRSVIGGGFENRIFYNNTAVIGGGCANILCSGTSGTIAGGWENIISNNCSWAFIGGGSQNTIGTNSKWGLIAGGRRNAIDHSANNAVIGGGEDNGIGASATHATVGGGFQNYAGGIASTVPGGQNCSAANTLTFAAGNRAKADHAGSFVWADSTDADFNTTAADQFLIRASGGVGIGATPPAPTPLLVAGNDPSGQFTETIRLEGTNATGAANTGAGISFSGHDGTDRRHWGYIRGLKENSTSGNTDSYLSFATRSGTIAERVRIESGGNVGIGTSNPDDLLHVHRGSAGSVTPLGNTIAVFENSANGFISILTPDADERGILFGEPSDNRAGSILYNSQAADGIEFRVNGNQSAMVINSSKNVGVGVLNPIYRLEAESTGTPMAVNRTGSDGNLIRFHRDGVQEGSISVLGGVVSYNNFTGSHPAWSEDPIERAMLVTLNGNNLSLHGDDDAEIIYGVKTTQRANDPAVLGAYLGLTEADVAFSLENPHLVMATGNGEVWIVDTGRDIRPGDYLISSHLPGHAMVDDRAEAQSHIIGRAGEAVHWSEVPVMSDGVKHKKISILFDAFVRDNRAAPSRVVALEKHVHELARVNEERGAMNAELEARIEELESMVKQLASHMPERVASLEHRQ